MRNWSAYHLRITLRSDIHCGDFPLGFVARTLPFVPGHLPFFALVPAAVNVLSMPDEHQQYKAVEHFFEKTVRFTPLFIWGSVENRVLYPWEKEDRSVLESYYLASQYGVAIDSKYRSARDGCLYETEVISASRRFDPLMATSFQQTELRGGVFIHAHAEGDFSMDETGTFSWKGRRASLEDLLRRMQLGGNRTRSLGRAGIPDLAPWHANDRLWGDYDILCDTEWPCVVLGPKQKGPLPLLMEGAEDCSLSFEGHREVIMGRRYVERGAGLGMDQARFVLRPGWKFIQESPISIALENQRYAVMSH